VPKTDEHAPTTPFEKTAAPENGHQKKNGELPEILEATPPRGVESVKDEPQATVPDLAAALAEAGPTLVEGPKVPPPAPVPVPAVMATGPLPVLVPEAPPPAPPPRETSPLDVAPFSPLPLPQSPPSPTRGILLVAIVAGVLAAGGAAFYWGFMRAQTDGPGEPPATAETPKPVVAETPKPVVAETPKPVVAETPKPVAAGESGIEVTTKPPGATVYIDGAARGPSPQQVALPKGSHTLAVALDGHKLYRKSVTIGDVVLRAEVPLEPARLPAEVAGSSGLKVRCRSTGELRIFVDGADTGRNCPNEERIAVSPGSHKIGLVSLKSGETHELEQNVSEDENHSTRVYVRY
jgi:hypothetical protein